MLKNDRVNKTEILTTANPNFQRSRCSAVQAQMSEKNDILIMAALRSRCGHYIFCPVVSFFFLFSPNLSGRRLDVYHTSTRDVA